MIEQKQEELEELQQISDAVCANLKKIEESGYCEDELKELEEQSSRVASNLKDIAEDQTDLDALEEQLDRIIAKLGQVREVEV